MRSLLEIFSPIPGKKCLYVMLVMAVMEMCQGCGTEVKQAGICLHIYLERDFPDIEPAVYRMHAELTGRRRIGQTDDYAFSGPALEDSCKKIKRVLQCFDRILKRDACYFYEDFFRFRHLLESLWKTFEWFCDVTKLRQRNLKQQRDCLMSHGTGCGPDATEIYGNATEIFIDDWCRDIISSSSTPISSRSSLIIGTQN
ncbi:unnamed protein product [Notodromas monacha]|uniref:Uncharacterized protein n=1 Tax=Notodromas monacha TaxID=399045 RepID=A0A7R9C229_9CRUS|nr:unnamed protein product [Notodromas monacha]CAG0924378.1 unnamed protein product [Notodromas monacha]